MKKKYVLKKNYEFQKIINKKKFVIDKYLVIYFSKNNFDHSRYGISISKKFANAVFRNFYKRKVRNILSNLEHEKKLDYVIILRKPFLKITYKKMELSIIELLKKVTYER